jgi:hypothetical protein
VASSRLRHSISGLFLTGPSGFQTLCARMMRPRCSHAFVNLICGGKWKPVRRGCDRSPARSLRPLTSGEPIARSPLAIGLTSSKPEKKPAGRLRRRLLLAAAGSSTTPVLPRFEAILPWI